jgi:hypothetical protein
MRTGHWLALLLLLSSSLGCRTPVAVSSSQPAPSSGDQQAERGEQPVAAGVWTPDGRGGRLEDEHSGLSLELPMGWTWRRGSGEVLFEARGPDSAPASLRLSRWDGSTSHLEELAAEEPLAFLSSGPHGGLDEIADEPPVVFTLPPSGDSDDLGLAWLFRVDSQGLSLEATLPAASFERSWQAVDAIVRSVATRRGEDF